MTIDLTSFQRALATLEEAEAARARAPDDGFIRDACIQRFEYTYERAHRMLRRHLAQVEADADAVQALSFVDLIRLGWERGLLSEEPAVWRRYRAARNHTSHGYDRARADQVLEIVPAFTLSAKALLVALGSSVERD